MYDNLPSFILSSIVYINKFFFKRVFFIWFRHSLWFFVFAAVSFGVWLDEFVGFFFIEVGSDLLGGVGGHSFLLVGRELNESSGGWCWHTIFDGESWDGVSDTGRPVLKILSFFSGISFGNGWLLSSQLDEGSGGWCWLSVFVAESWNSVSDTRSPVLKILSVFSSISFGNGWLFRFGLGKLVSAILESALNKVEEVSHELSFLLLINSSEEFSVHLSLEELVHIGLEISLKKSLFSKSNLMHVSVHAHGFNFSLHLRS